MKHLSRMAESLLREILDHRDERGNCDTTYWQQRFDNLSVSEDALLRSLFKELREEDMISVDWADNCPYILLLLAKGLSYFEEKELSENSKSNTYTNNFYNTVSGVQIQQGSVNSRQNQTLPKSMDISDINKLIQTIRHYNSVLNEDYGTEDADKIRTLTNDLETAVNNHENTDNVKRMLTYIRDLSANASGSLVAVGIMNLIKKIMG